MAAKKAVVARETSPSAETALRVVNPPEGTPTVARGGDVAVWMPAACAPGVRAFGDYLPGTVYQVPAKEALRLVTAKGFRFASAADHRAVSDYVDGIADATETPKE